MDGPPRLFEAGNNRCWVVKCFSALRLAAICNWRDNPDTTIPEAAAAWELRWAFERLRERLSASTCACYLSGSRTATPLGPLTAQHGSLPLPLCTSVTQPRVPQALPSNALLQSRQLPRTAGKRQPLALLLPPEDEWRAVWPQQ